MAHRTRFYIYKRKKTKRSYWYVCYLDPVTGKQGTAKSIDVLKEKLGYMDFETVSRRDEAVIIAQKALERGLIDARESRVFFADYCLQFWDYDSSKYIAMRNFTKPNSIGREYANNMVYSLKKHIIPIIPKDLLIQNVTTEFLESIVLKLYEKGLASGSIQIIAYSFLLPLKEAKRIGLIANNPASNMMRISRKEKIRGCLTLDEISRLGKALEEQKKNMYHSYYLAILLAIITGMRSGEIRALHESDIVSSDINGWKKINITHSIAPYTGLKDTKSNYGRAVLIPDYIASELVGNANKDGLLLPSKQNCSYISAPTLRFEFYLLLKSIGITEKEREERNITFHSLRHTFSTLGRDLKISQEDRMVVLGHKSIDVNDRYTHESTNALKSVSSLTDALIALMKSEE